MRSKGEAGEWLAWIRELLTGAGVEPRLTLNLPRTEAIFWKNGARTTLCVVKNVERKASIDEFGKATDAVGQGPEKLKLSFAQPVKELRNERTGKVLGAGREFVDDFTPWEANVYTFAP